MLEDRREYACRTLDLAAGGLALECGKRGLIGERIIAYVNDLGRLEGEIVRQLKGGFAFKIQASERKVEKLAARIARLVQRDLLGLPDARARIATEDGQTILATEDGDEVLATLIDVSPHGAALSVAAAPPVGAGVTVGPARGRVARHFAGGIAVTFHPPLIGAAEAADPLAEP